MKVKVSYQTLVLPPPHSFAYTLDLEFLDHELKIDYNLEFLNRDEVTLEEIEEEGYSANDDFKWTGTLGREWVEDLADDLLQAELEEENEELDVYLHLEITHNGETDSGLAVLAEEWDYRLQELIQAIYEKAGLEKALQMKIINIQGAQRSYHEINASFVTKSAKLNSKTITWEDLHDIMSQVYIVEYDGESEEKPSKDGLWIDPNGESGYFKFDTENNKEITKAKNILLDLIKKLG